MVFCPQMEFLPPFTGPPSNLHDLSTPCSLASPCLYCTALIMTTLFLSLCSGLLQAPLDIFSLLPQMKNPFLNESVMLSISVMSPLAYIWSTNGYV